MIVLLSDFLLYTFYFSIVFYGTNVIFLFKNCMRSLRMHHIRIGSWVLLTEWGIEHFMYFCACLRIRWCNRIRLILNLKCCVSLVQVFTFCRVLCFCFLFLIEKSLFRLIDWPRFSRRVVDASDKYLHPVSSSNIL